MRLKMNYLLALEKETISFPDLGWNFKISNVAVTIFGIQLYWYGILIAGAVALCLFLSMKQCRKYGLTPDLLTDFCLLAIPMAFVGARLYYVICEWDNYYVKGNFKKTFDAIINVRSGGLAIYGGVLGALLAVLIMGKIRKVPISTVLDFAIVYIPLGQAIGRWGNFFNQEAFGTTTNLPWGMTSNSISRYLAENCPKLDASLPVHPTFFYESVATLLIFVLLMIIRKKSTRAWTTLSCYCIFYGVVRFFIEGLRTDSLYIAHTNLRTSQVLSLILVVFGLIMISLARMYDWEKKAIPERFIKADEAMLREAARKKEAKLRSYDEDEDEEDRVERLSKKEFTLKEDDSDEKDAETESDEESEEDTEEDTEDADTEEASDEEDTDDETEDGSSDK